jgi:HEPN domain-containing protein
LEIEFPRSHDIEALVRLLPKGIDFSLTVEQQRTLTDYATVTRYPGGYEPVSLTEAKEAVKIARQFKRKVLKLLENKGLF